MAGRADNAGGEHATNSGGRRRIDRKELALLRQTRLEGSHRDPGLDRDNLVGRLVLDDAIERPQAQRNIVAAGRVAQPDVEARSPRDDGHIVGSHGREHGGNLIDCLGRCHEGWTHAIHVVRGVRPADALAEDILQRACDVRNRGVGSHR